MIGYQWNVNVKAYDITSRRQRRSYHIQIEAIRNSNARIMRKNLRRVFRHQKEALEQLDDPTDMGQVAIAVLSTNDELRNAFAYSYKRVARDVYPMLVSTPKAKSFIQMEYKERDPDRQYFDIVLAQWINDNLGEKIVKVQQTTLDQLRRSYTRISQGFQQNASQTEFRDAVIKDFLKTYDHNISTFRANCIARTECAAATNRSALETTKAIGGDPQKEWMAVGDMDTRDTHQFMDGKVVAFNEMFDVNGSMMDCPLDSTHGADVAEIANCRCNVGFRHG